MTDGHSLTSGALLQLALSALTNHSADEAEEKLASIITSLEQHYGENQKEVANELQRLAKEIENSGQIEQAIEFKQRTTELMLRISMERRRGLRESRPADCRASDTSVTHQQSSKAAGLLSSRLQ
jgi:uncharacterized membrane-anchored protein